MIKKKNPIEKWLEKELRLPFRKIDFLKLTILMILLEFSFVFIFYLTFSLSRHFVINDFVIDIKNLFLPIVGMSIGITFIPKMFNKVGNLTKIKKFKNPFVSMSFLSMTIMIALSLGVISEIYSSVLPITTDYVQSEKNVSLNLACWGLGKFNMPIADQFFNCFANIRDKSSQGILKRSYMVEAIQIHYPEDNTTERGVGFTRTKTDNYSFYYEGISVPVGKEGLNNLKLRFTFLDENGQQFFVESGFISYTAMNFDSYNRRQSEKTGFYLTGISLSFFASFIGVKNLMDIWDRRKK